MSEFFGMTPEGISDSVSIWKALGIWLLYRAALELALPVILTSLQEQTEGCEGLIAKTISPHNLHSAAQYIIREIWYY